MPEGALGKLLLGDKIKAVIGFSVTV